MSRPRTPPEKLRAELERLRDRGEPFKFAWSRAVNHAIADESLSTSCFYREVFAEQKLLWSVSYSRTPWPANRRPVLDVFDDDYSSPAGRERGAPVLA